MGMICCSPTCDQKDRKMNVMQMLSLTRKTALVTGGAGLYGRQIVEALAEAFDVTPVCRRNRCETDPPIT